MVALSEAGAISLCTAGLSATALVLVALIGRGNRLGRAEARKDRADLKDAVRAENGHPTLGGGLAAVEDRLIAGEARFDAIDVHLADISIGLAEQNERFNEHIEAVTPLTEWVREQMEEEA